VARRTEIVSITQAPQQVQDVKGVAQHGGDNTRSHLRFEGIGISVVDVVGGSVGGDRVA
jgi:hypothetical protein